MSCTWAHFDASPYTGKSAPLHIQGNPTFGEKPMFCYPAMKVNSSSHSMATQKRRLDVGGILPTLCGCPLANICKNENLTTQNNSPVDGLMLPGHLSNRLTISYRFVLLPHRDAGSIFSWTSLSAQLWYVGRFSVGMQYHQKSFEIGRHSHSNKAKGG